MNIAVILAGGTGKRIASVKPKQFLKIAGKTVLEHTIDVFQRCLSIDMVIVIVHHEYFHDVEQMVISNQWSKVKKILLGGSERYESSLIAIRACAEYGENTKIIFHDAVRPLVSFRIIEDTIAALDTYDAVDVAIPTVDTIIELNKEKQWIEKIPNRSYIYRGQTPQGFRLGVIKKAYEIALLDEAFQTTDDCGIVKTYLPNTAVHVVEGEERNMKITYPEDVFLMDKLFQLKAMSLFNQSLKMEELRHKVIVVFGGNSGIGQDMVRISALYQARIYSFSRSLNQIDVANPYLVEKALKMVADKEGKIDYVVNTAAVLNKNLILNLNLKEIREIIETNYFGVINTTLSSFPYLKQSKGQILQFTSSSYTRGRAYYSLYSSSKAAVVNFVQAIAEEWCQYHIRINCINPQRTKTKMRIINFGAEEESSLLKSEDVAQIALKTLLSNFTGEVIDVKLENHRMKYLV